MAQAGFGPCMSS